MRELPVPELDPGSILVQVEVATICGSDVHIWEGSQQGALTINLPIVPVTRSSGGSSHSVTGCNYDSAGDPLEVGDRIVWDNASCGHCYECTVAGLPNLCRSRQTFFAARCDEPPYLLGSFSDYAYVPPRAAASGCPTT